MSETRCYPNMLSNDCLILISLLEKRPKTQAEIRRFGYKATKGSFSPKKGGTKKRLDLLIGEGLVEEFTEGKTKRYCLRYCLTECGNRQARILRSKLENLLYDGPTAHLDSAVTRVVLYSEEVEPEEAADVLEFAAGEIAAARKNLDQDG